MKRIIIAIVLILLCLAASVTEVFFISRNVTAYCSDIEQIDLCMRKVDFERALLVPVKNLADYTIETSYMSNKQLRERVMNLFMEDASQSLTLTFMSFGFKYGIPLEADLIIDVRCLPNPFYIPELKPLTGLDEAVKNYVLGSGETQEFGWRTLYWLDFSVPLYRKEGKSELVVGIGCTGGKHRNDPGGRKGETCA